MILINRNSFSFMFPSSKLLWYSSFDSFQIYKHFSKFIKPESIPAEKWKHLIWVAMDLKKTVVKNNKECLNLLKDKHVTLLFEKPHGRFQLAFTLACNILGARKTPFFESNFQNQPSPGDLGKALSQLTDMFIVHGVHHDKLLQFGSATTVPLFPASCNIYSLQKVLSDLMTLQEKFNKLRGLTLAWIGPPTPIFNAYLLLCPLFGMKIRYLCICVYGSGKMSPITKLYEKKVQDAHDGSILECKSVEDVVDKANIIVTSMHPEEKNQINSETLKGADKDWVFIHDLPRSQLEVADDIFNHPKNLSWATSRNYLYMAMAIILTNLKSYKPSISQPNFEEN